MWEFSHTKKFKTCFLRKKEGTKSFLSPITHRPTKTILATLSSLLETFKEASRNSSLVNTEKAEGIGGAHA